MSSGEYMRLRTATAVRPVSTCRRRCVYLGCAAAWTDTAVDRYSSAEIQQCEKYGVEGVKKVVQRGEEGVKKVVQRGESIYSEKHIQCEKYRVRDTVLQGKVKSVRFSVNVQLVYN